MTTNGLNMKAFIATDNNLYDVNEQFLEAGKYYFLIQHFTDKNSVIGKILSSTTSVKTNSQFEFRYFSLMTMVVKGQSYLAHRVNKQSLSSSLLSKIDNMPNYPSPKKPNPKRISYLRNMSKPFQCMICLHELDNYDLNLKKLPCGHKFHSKCVKEWLTHKNTCPICRKKII